MSDQPMRCHQVARYLSPFADGELAPDLRELVERHVDGCLNCQQEVRRHQATSRLIATLPKSAPSPEVLDRVLAATAAQPPEPVLRESLRSPWRARAAAPRVRAFRPAPVSVHHPSRPDLLPLSPRLPARARGARPVLAASLLIALAVLAFMRFPLSTALNSVTPTPPAPAVESVLNETRTAVSAHGGSLAFTPVTPTYLPRGARFEGVAVSPPNASRDERALDVVWSLGFPLASLRLREAPVVLTARADYLPASETSAFSWQIGAAPWRSGQVLSAPGNLAVGQDREGYSLTLDVGVQDASGSQQEQQVRQAAITVLRLVSLSLDAPYLPLRVLAPDAHALALHYTAHGATSVGPTTWDVYYDPVRSLSRVQVAISSSAAPLYVDVGAESGVIRFVPASHTYRRLTPTEAGDPLALRDDVVAFLDGTNSLLADGELWNLGTQAVGARRLITLVLVGAPHPTFIFVDPASQRITSARVEESAVEHPGGSGASSHLTPAQACPSYTLIEYLDPATLPAGLFDAPSLQGYVAIDSIPTAHCGS